MRDLAKALSNIKIFEYDEDFVAVCDERNGMLSFPLGLVYEAIERAIKAEAEVERLRLMVKSITSGLDEAMETVHFLEAENAKLRAVLFEPSIETLASKVHDGWWEEKKLQGFHAPLECPYRTPTNLYGKFEAVCDQCHTDMYPYNELPENIKNYDRVTVKAVLQAVAELDKEGGE